MGEYTRTSEIIDAACDDCIVGANHAHIAKSIEGWGKADSFIELASLGCEGKQEISGHKGRVVHVCPLLVTIELSDEASRYLRGEQDPFNRQI